MNTITSRLFGELEYTEDEVYTFPAGLLGFPDYHQFILRERPETGPIVWLISVDDGGPEFPMIDPAEVMPERADETVPLDKRMTKQLRCEDSYDIAAYAIVTVPENIRQISANLRTPILINRATKRGIEYPQPGLPNRPVRCRLYRDLVGSRAEDKPGTLIMHRKAGETIEIGDEISIQILEYVNGGVRLSITAPKHTKVSRGDGAVTPKQETIRANDPKDLKQLEGLMRMHRVVSNPGTELGETILEIVPDRDEPHQAIG